MYTLRWTTGIRRNTKVKFILNGVLYFSNMLAQTLQYFETYKTECCSCGCFDISHCNESRIQINEFYIWPDKDETAQLENHHVPALRQNLSSVLECTNFLWNSAKSIGGESWTVFITTYCRNTCRHDHQFQDAPVFLHISTVCTEILKGFCKFDIEYIMAVWCWEAAC